MEQEQFLEVFDSRKQTVVRVILDSNDYERFKDYKWKIDDGGYARRNVWVDDGSKRYCKTLLMHRCVLGVENEPSSDLCVDHINGDPLDNRKSNLRLVTYRVNAANRHSVLTTTGVLRVTKDGNRYVARVRRDGVPVYLGSFITPQEAEEAINLYLQTGEFFRPIRKVKPVVQQSIDGDIIAVYENCAEASRKTGVCMANINRVANNNRQRRTQAGGYIWSYAWEFTPTPA